MKRKTFRILSVATILMISWIILSQEFDPFHLGWGAFCSVFAAYLSYPTTFGKQSLTDEKLFPFVRFFLFYMPWILWQILISNFKIAFLTLHPRLPISPNWIFFHFPSKVPISRFMTAHSITLTPGTATINLEKDTFLVHSLVVENLNDQSYKDKSSIPGRVYEMFDENDSKTLKEKA